jgi:hypothetical protein
MRGLSRRPRLVIIFGDQPPLLSIEPSATAPEWQYVRAMVTNKGKKGVPGVRAHISGAWVRPDLQNRADGQEWVSLVTLPIQLRWKSRSHRPSGAGPIDLAAGNTDYLDVSRKSLVQHNGKYDHMFCGLDDEVYSPSVLDLMTLVGEYRIEVAIYFDEFRMTSVVSYKQGDSALQLGDVHKAERPREHLN